MKRLIAIFSIIALAAVAAVAQTMSVAGFEERSMDMDARVTHPVTDPNGQTCALIKVETTQTGFGFDTGVIQVVKTEQKNGEVWVYVQPRVKKISIMHQDYEPVRDYYFPTGALKEATVYLLKLRTAGAPVQVSKGSASVKNGYESITGQINVEYLKPEDEQAVEVNLFGDSKSRIEANAAANLHVGKRAGGNLMLHYENSINNHDENHDGFYDKPRVEQYNAQSRWLWKGDRYIFHGGLSGLKEKRRGGQTGHGMAAETPRFGIAVNTDRYEAYAKNAFIINPEHATNVALMASGSMHETDAVFGGKTYYVNEKNAYVSLMFETNFSERHNLSAGLSLNHDYFGQLYRLSHYATDATRDNEKETTPGVYAQYTLTLGKTLTAMAGIRADHSSVYGTFVTPRFHIKYAPSSLASFRLSAGKGYRTVHALAENNYLLASGRRLAVDPLKQEAAWNYGFSAALSIPIAGKALKVNAEYYYTHFSEQAVIDYDTNPSEIRITNLNGGKSFSHTMQVDATYPFFQGFSVTAAYRLNDVRTTFGGTLREKPLTSRYKALLTASYKTALDLWQFDATLQINGGGRMPEPYTLGDGSLSWQRRFNAYPQLSAQVTRWFRHWSIYVGGENLTNFKQKTPIIAASDPWSERFDPTMVWGPVHGWMLYAGVRINFGKL
jgi:hypothetical protein